MEDALYSNTPSFTFENIVTTAKVVRVHDGDTVYVVFQYYGKMVKLMCRLYGLDAPELKLNRDIAIKARNRLVQLATDCSIELDNLTNNIQELIDKNKKIVIAEFFGKEKYGRELVKLYNEDHVCINSILLKEGFCKEYSGGTKQDWNQVESL